MNATEVIVYRNPAEKVFWDMVMNGDMMYLVAGVVAFFVIFLLANRVLTGGNNLWQPAWKMNTALALGASAGLAAIFLLPRYV